MQRILFDINDNLSPYRQRIHNIRFQGLSQASVHAWRQRLTSYVSEPIHPLVMKYLVDEQSTLDAIQLRMLRPYFPVVELRDRAASMRVKLCWRLAASVAILYRELDRGFLCPAVFLDALPVEELDPAHFSYDKEIGLFRILLHHRVALQPPENSICVSSLATGPCSSPEVLQGFPGNTQSVMWTLGCLLYMLCCGHYPFGESQAQVLPTILSTFGPSASIKRASALIAKVPPVIRPLLQRLLVYKPSERLTPAELLALPEVHELLSKLSHINRTLPHPVVIASLFHPPLDAPQPLVVPYWLQKSLNGRSDGLSSVTENSLESVLLDLPDYLPIAQSGSNGVYEGFVLKNRTIGGHVFCKVYRVGDDSATQRVIAGYFAEIASVSHPGPADAVLRAPVAHPGPASGSSRLARPAYQEGPTRRPHSSIPPRPAAGWRGPSEFGGGRGAGPRCRRPALYGPQLQGGGCPGRHFGGNQLPGGSMSLSPPCPAPTSDLRVSTAAGLHQAFARPHPRRA